MLLDALATFGFLTKNDGRYAVPEEFHAALDSRTPESQIPILAHWGACQRSWSQLAFAVKNGVPAPKTAGVGGPAAELRAFLLGMNSIGHRIAPLLADEMARAFPNGFERMLDLGGASGTYSLAFLKTKVVRNAALFDIPLAVEEARARFRGPEGAPFAERVTFFPGDFYRDPFPDGCDLHWISAIIHQQDEKATRAMFAESFRTLAPGGVIAIRDVYAAPDRIGPPAAALFAVNMLVNTASGRVYTRAEVESLLSECGFVRFRTVRSADDMTSILAAEKP